MNDEWKENTFQIITIFHCIITKINQKALKYFTSCVTNIEYWLLHNILFLILDALL